MQPLAHGKILEKVTILHQADFVRAPGSTAVLDCSTLLTAHVHLVAAIACGQRSKKVLNRVQTFASSVSQRLGRGIQDSEWIRVLFAYSPLPYIYAAYIGCAIRITGCLVTLLLFNFRCGCTRDVQRWPTSASFQLPSAIPSARSAAEALWLPPRLHAVQFRKFPPLDFTPAQDRPRTRSSNQHRPGSTNTPSVVHICFSWSQKLSASLFSQPAATAPA